MPVWGFVGFAALGPCFFKSFTADGICWCSCVGVHARDFSSLVDGSSAPFHCGPWSKDGKLRLLFLYHKCYFNKGGELLY